MIIGLMNFNVPVEIGAWIFLSPNLSRDASEHEVTGRQLIEITNNINFYGCGRHVGCFFIRTGIK